jgi:hypothetical protein
VCRCCRKTPAIGEFVPGYEASFRIGAPRNTLASIIERLLASPGMKARLADDTEKWGKVIRANNIKPE